MEAFGPREMTAARVAFLRSYTTAQMVMYEELHSQVRSVHTARMEVVGRHRSRSRPRKSFQRESELPRGELETSQGMWRFDRRFRLKPV